MALFYADMKGSRGPASRLGCKTSGINTSTKSWDGEVNVRMWAVYDRVTKEYTPHVRLMVGPHDSGGRVCVYDGPVSHMQEQCALMVATYKDLGPLGVLALTEHYKRAV